MSILFDTFKVFFRSKSGLLKPFFLNYHIVKKVFNRYDIFKNTAKKLKKHNCQKTFIDVT